MRWHVALHGGAAADGASVSDTAVTVARIARDHGYDGVVVGQHFLTGPQAYLQPLSLLSRLVPETGDIDLVAGILLLPFLHPVQLAEELGTVDALSDGRLVVGIGQGYRDVEFAAFGVNRSDRLRVQLDHLDRLLELWDPQSAGTPGQLAMPPTQQPRPPIWYAASTSRSFSRAVHRGLVPFLGPQVALTDVDEFVHHGPPCDDIALRRDVLVTDVVGPDRAERAVAQHAQRYAAWGYSMSGGGSSPYVIGNADECRGRIAELAAHGVTQVVVRTNWPGLSTQESADMLVALRS